MATAKAESIEIICLNITATFNWARNPAYGQESPLIGDTILCDLGNAKGVKFISASWQAGIT
jgi:hypothetical protein